MPSELLLDGAFKQNHRITFFVLITSIYIYRTSSSGAFPQGLQLVCDAKSNLGQQGVGLLHSLLFTISPQSARGLPDQGGTQPGKMALGRHERALWAPGACPRPGAFDASVVKPGGARMLRQWTECTGGEHSGEGWTKEQIARGG